MGTFLLILITLNTQTGAVVRTKPVAAPFSTAAECSRAAIERGPQPADIYETQMLVCRSSAERPPEQDDKVCAWRQHFLICIPARRDLADLALSLTCPAQSTMPVQAAR